MIPDSLSDVAGRSPAFVSMIAMFMSRPLVRGRTALPTRARHEVLPEISAALDVSVRSAGRLNTVFAIGMMIGAPLMGMATLKLPRRSTFIAALVVSRPVTSSAR